MKSDKKTGFQQRLCQVIDFKSEHVIAILRYLIKSQYVLVIVIVKSLIFKEILRYFYSGLKFDLFALYVCCLLFDDKIPPCS